MNDMPNIASALKSEISRIARREIRAEVESIKKTSAQYRSQIAALKRNVAALERQIRQAPKQRDGKPDAGDERTAPKRRYSAKRLAAHRAKLGLSTASYGRLCGVSGQTIYRWEQEKARPRQSQLEGIAAVRGLGIREATARLEQLQS